MGGDEPLPYDNSGNIDATHSNTAPTWTNHPHALRPVASQQVETNSATQFINVADEISSSRRTYNPANSAAGDTEAIAARGSRGVPPRISQAGRLRSYLVLINGAVPTVQAQTGAYPSELFSHRNPTYNENTIAVSSDRGALEISGANLMYEGTRVKTWIVGRDLNPGGRGDGAPVCWSCTHLSGAMGMIYTPEEHHRKGYAKSLSAFQIDTMLERFGIAFCHILDWNIASQGLVKSFEAVQNDEPLVWRGVKWPGSMG